VDDAEILEILLGLCYLVVREGKLIELGKFIAKLVDLVPVRDEVILERELLEVLKEAVEVSQVAEVTDLALCEGDALQFIEVVDFVPNLVEADKLNEDLL